MVRSPPSRSSRIIRRFSWIIIGIIIALLIVSVVALFLLQTASVQNFGRKKIQAYLESRLHTKVVIGELSIDFPKNIVLKNVYLEDQRQDTLLFAGNVNLDVNLWRLFRRQIVVNNINLDQTTIHLERRLPDSNFNDAFISRAFASKNTKPEKTPEKNSPWTFELGNIHLTNIHAHYQDDATGNDITFFLSDLQTSIKTFDPDQMHFAISEFAVHELNGFWRQYGPRHPLTLKFDIGHLSVLVNSMDLNKMHFDLQSLNLDQSNVQLLTGKSDRQNAETKEKTGSSPAWSVNLAGLNLVNDVFRYDDEEKKPAKDAIDYAHLLVSNLNTSMSGLSLSADNYKGEIKKLSLSEKSGFELKSLSTIFSYNDQRASVNNLVMLTSYTNLKSNTSLKYASVASLSGNPGDIAGDVAFDHSYIGMHDILLFVPSLRSRWQKEQNARIMINGNINGKLNNLNVANLQLAGLQFTRLEFSGQITGLTNINKAICHIQIKNLSSTKTDLKNLLPENIIPTNMRFPDTISAFGRIDGGLDQFSLDMMFNSGFGKLAAKGQLNIPKKQYDLNVDLGAFDLGKLLYQDSLLGKVDMQATVKGKGFDLKTMQTVAHFQIPAARVNGYDYGNLTMHVSMLDGLYHIQSVMHDPNAQWQLDAKGKWIVKFPTLILDLKMDTINLQVLHWMKDSLAMSFSLHTNLTSTDPDSLEGKIYLTKLGVNYRNKKLFTDSIYLIAARKDALQSLLLRSKMADLSWTGKYKITEIKRALKQTINHYYKFPRFVEEKISPQNWQMNLQLRPSSNLLLYDPTLTGSDTIEMKIGFNSLTNDLHLSLLAPSIHFKGQFIHQLSATAGTKDSVFNYAMQFGSAKWAGLDLYRSGIFGWLANNQFRNTVFLNDAKDRERYRVATLFSGLPDGWKLSLLPDSLRLNYDVWKTSEDNFIQYDSSGLLVNHLQIDHKNQSLLINSRSSSADSPIDVSFENFSIRTLTSFAGQDSLLLDGELNGRSELRNMLTNPSFTSNLKVNNLSYSQDTLGNLAVLVDNLQANIFSNRLSLEGKDNDVRVSGTYDSREKRMSMSVDIGKLDLSMVKSLSAGQVRDIRGWLKGNLHATGSLSQPVLTGSLHFDSAYITPAFSGERLKLSTDSILFNSEGIRFNQFSFLDSAGHQADLNGQLYTKDYKHFRSDLTFNAKNFIVVNTPIQTNQNFYGKLNMDVGLQIKGDMDAPTLTGNLRVNKETDFTLILPNSDPEVVSRQGVVLFVDKDHPLDTARMRTYLDSLNRNAGFRGINAIANIETDSSAQFTMIVNERTGDALSVKGRASLSGSMNRNGKMSLTGTYVLEDGDYDLTLRLLKRKFNLQKGSTITWTGDPTGATIDITATYLCTTAPISLVGNQMSGMSQQEINELNQKLPFQVNLKMQGLLLKPQISFSITLPPNQAALWQNVDSKLTELNSNAAEVNKQVFALLLFNTFISENPFESTSGGNSTASLMASQSASSILTAQLNALAGGFAKKIDLSMNVNTDQSYNTSGQAVNQTALQLGVSKNLFGDRVKVTVGSDFQLAGASQGPNASNIAGNVKIDYTLTPDGKYIIRVYSLNQYNTVVEGQVVETGASFIITLDFDEFNELFQKKNKTNPGQQ